MPKTSKVILEKRIFTVQGWLIEAVPDYLILKQIIDNWNLSRRQARRYLDDAYKRWNVDTDATTDDKRQRAIARLQNEIRTMDEKFKNTPAGKATILRYEKEINKLEGLYRPKKVQLSNDPENPVEIGGSQVVVFQLPDNKRK